jgi:hypothetical protein
MAGSAVERLRADFRKKEEILGHYGEWYSRDMFYDTVFHGAKETEKIMLVEAGKKYLALPREEAMEFSVGRDDVYFCSAHFHDDFKNDNFIDTLYAFIIDIDDLSPVFLEEILKGIIQRGTAPLPTMVVNSGQGVHFYYVLQEPLHVYPTTRKKARELYRVLNEVYEYAPDKHSIGHAFRGVGSLTKLGDVATGYKIGDFWTVEDLGDAVGYNWYIPDIASKEGEAASEKMQRYASHLAELYGVPEPDFSSFIETHQFIEDMTKGHFKQGTLSNKDFEAESGVFLTDAAPNGSPAWYRRTRDAVLEKTELEHRYKSLMALSVIAYKCRIPYEQLQKDVEHIVNRWAVDARWGRNPFNMKNVPAALRCYSQKFIRVRRETLEDWLGWEFPGRKKEKKYKDQQEWLETLADQRSGASVRKIRAVLEEDIYMKKTEIARRTGLSRQTVYTHYPAALAYVKRRKKLS